jgi:hypothetical protein
MGLPVRVSCSDRCVAAVVLVLALVTSCASDADQPEATASTSGSPSEHSSTAQPSASPPRGADPSTDVAGTPQPAASPSCQDLQGQAARRLEWPLVQAVWLLTSDADGRSATAGARIRGVLDRVAGKVRERCAPLPSQLRALRERVRSTTRSPLDALGVRRLESVFDRWVRAVDGGRSPMAGASDLVRSCRLLGEQVRAGYALWWDHVPEGRRWWVQMVVENETDRQYWLNLDGTMWVTGLRWPIQSHMPRDRRNGARQISWGGSSADSMYAKPHATTSRRVGLTANVHTTLTGEVYDVRPRVFLSGPDGSCSLPVPRLN